MNKKAIAALLLTLACLSATATVAQARAPIQELNHIVAVVDDDVITATELQERLNTVKRQLRQANTPMPDDKVLTKQVLDRLVLERIQLALADKTGVQVDDQTLNDVISRIAADNRMSLDQFRMVLENDGYNFAEFRENIRNELIINRLRARQVDNRVTVSPQEVSDLVESAGANAALQTEYHLSHILVAVPESATPEQVQAARAKADMVLGRLHEGADFREMAVAYSDGPQALKGGDLGWRKGGQLPTLFTDQVFAMKDGQISDLIRSANGFHILKLEERRGETKHMVQQTHARHILIKTDEITSDDAAQARLERLRERILGGDDFAELARANSDDPGSAAKGGDLGWASPGQFVPAFESHLNDLAPGQISKPFKSRFGWHIVQVLDRRQYDNTEEFLRTQAKESLRKRKVEQARESWLRRLRDEAYVEFRLSGDVPRG